MFCTVRYLHLSWCLLIQKVIQFITKINYTHRFGPGSDVSVYVCVRVCTSPVDLSVHLLRCRRTDAVLSSVHCDGVQLLRLCAGNPGLESGSGARGGRERRARAAGEAGGAAAAAAADRMVISSNPRVGG